MAGDELEKARSEVTLKSLKPDLKLLLKLADQRGLDPGDMKAILGKLPGPKHLGELVEKATATLLEELESTLRDRTHRFTPIIAEFIEGCRNEGLPVKELGAGWRIDRLELETNSEQSLIRFTYNREPLHDWKPISSAAELARICKESQASLKFAQSQPMIFRDNLLLAYDNEVGRRRNTVSSRHAHVPMSDLIRSFRAVLLRDLLDKKSPDQNLPKVGFEKWEFLARLDAFRLGLGPNGNDGNDDLVFDTGSQQVPRKDCVFLSQRDPLAPLELRCFCHRTSA